MAKKFSLLISLLISVTQAWPIDETFSVWIWRCSVVVGHFLYIDGGEWYAKPDGGSPSIEELSLTYAIDLSTSWNTDTVNALTNSRPTDMSTVRRPSLWYDAESNYVYEWGGWPYDDNHDNLLWSFQPDGKGGAVWTQNPAPASQGQPLSAPLGASWVSTPSAFYSLSGAIVPGNQQYNPNNTAQGLVSYNFSSNTWSNTSSTGFSDGGSLVFGENIFVPNFGPEGLLVFLGGSTPSNQSYQYGTGITLASMEIITVYDLQSGKWYHQNATGDTPPVRSNFCSVGVATPDNSSFEIFIYGGSSFPKKAEGMKNDDYEDVFVLSLPAFNWFRASGTSAKRAWHYCDLIGKRQMIVIGGADPTITLGTAPDPWTHGLGIFDMTELSWSNSYNASAQSYEQPSIIKEYYAGNHPQPSAWNDPALAAVFAASTTAAINTKPSTSSGGESAAASGSSVAHHTNVGAIAGGVVGGVVVICILLGLILYLLRRQRPRQRNKNSPPISELDRKSPPQEMPVDLSYRSLHQLGPADAWELDAIRGSVVKRSSVSEVEG